MKNIFTLILLFFVAITSYAQAITREYAKELAQKGKFKQALIKDDSIIN